MPSPYPTFQTITIALAMGLVVACGSSSGQPQGIGSLTSATEAPPPAPATSVSVTIAWAPADGPVEAYQLSVERNGSSTVNEATFYPTAGATLEEEVGSVIRVRVAAVDADGGIGPPSAWSVPILMSENGPTAASSGEESTAAVAAAPASLAEPATEVSDDATVGAAREQFARSDINGDGAADLVWVSGNNVLATQVGGSALETIADVTHPNATVSAIGLGDFDADNVIDLLWQSETGELSYSAFDGTTNFVSIGQLARGEGVAALTDLDADGATDLIIEDSARLTSRWRLTEAGIEIAAMEAPEAGAVVVASGDLDGNDHGDIVWQTIDGQLLVDFMGSDGIEATAIASDTAASLGTGDLDGDGQDDLLTRDTQGVLVALAFADQSPVLTVAPVDSGVDWEVVSIADYDGDGFADVLWRREGAMTLRTAGGEDLPVAAGASWTLVPHSL